MRECPRRLQAIIYNNGKFIMLDNLRKSDYAKICHNKLDVYRYSLYAPPPAPLLFLVMGLARNHSGGTGTGSSQPSQ